MVEGSRPAAAGDDARHHDDSHDARRSAFGQRKLMVLVFVRRVG